MIVFFVGDMGKYLTGGTPDRLLAAFPLIWELRLFKCSKKRTLFLLPPSTYSRGVWVSGDIKAVNRERRGEKRLTEEHLHTRFSLVCEFPSKKKKLHTWPNRRRECFASPYMEFCRVVVHNDFPDH